MMAFVVPPCTLFVPSRGPRELVVKSCELIPGLLFLLTFMAKSSYESSRRRIELTFCSCPICISGQLREIKTLIRRWKKAKPAYVVGMQNCIVRFVTALLDSGGAN